MVSNQNLKVRKLYFNHNDLTDKTGIKVVELLVNVNTNLKELGLKRNKLTAISGNQIAGALKNNGCLKVLDLSWNSLGVKPRDRIDPKTRKQIKGMSAGDVGRAWGLCFLENKSLIHVDLSFNKINQVDTEAFAQDFQFNQTCVGFHFHGNIGKKDPPEPVDPKKAKKKEKDAKLKEAKLKEAEVETGPMWEKASFIDSQGNLRFIDSYLHNPGI